ncbi:MAG: hypothetical protein LQ341_000236 [Variospora aurantia]|nr:MAG: hypothetical protein LQ341_000236 [Variospora aurantia]
MSRHNRRRTRASHRKQPAFTQFTTSGFRKLGAVTVHLEPIQLHFCGSKQANAHRTELSAQHWHSRYIAWQRHDRRQREEPERLLAEQRRIFGGEMEEGDEDGLCSNMMAHAEVRLAAIPIQSQVKLDEASRATTRYGPQRLVIESGSMQVRRMETPTVSDSCVLASTV